MLINTTECAGRDLTGRPILTAVLMTPDEIQRARKVLDNAVFDAAARIAGTMPLAEPTPSSAPSTPAVDQASLNERTDNTNAPHDGGAS